MKFLRQQDVKDKEYILTEAAKFIGSQGYVYARPFPDEIVRVKDELTGEMNVLRNGGQDGGGDAFLVYVRVTSELCLPSMPCAFHMGPSSDAYVRFAFTVNAPPGLSFYTHFDSYEFPSDDDFANIDTDPRQCLCHNDRGDVEKWLFLNCMGVRWESEEIYMQYMIRKELLQPYRFTRVTSTTTRYHYHGNGYTVAGFIPHALRQAGVSPTKIRSLDFYAEELCYGKMLHVPNDYRLWFMGKDLLPEQEDSIDNHVAVLSDFSVVVPDDQPIDLYILRMSKQTNQR